MSVARCIGFPAGKPEALKCLERMSRAANGSRNLIHAVAAFWAELHVLMLLLSDLWTCWRFFSESTKHVRSRQALLGSWQGLELSRMTTPVCTMALFSTVPEEPCSVVHGIPPTTAGMSCPMWSGGIAVRIRDLDGRSTNASSSAPHILSKVVNH